MTRQRNRQQGFVLLLTLVLILLAAVALAGLARRSLMTALHAERATEDLQRRWAVISLQAAMLPKVEQVLSQAERESDEPKSTKRLSIHLGELDFQLVFSDEQAKANVNHLYQTLDRQEATVAIRRLTAAGRGSTGRSVDVRLRPHPPSPTQQADAAADPFATFGQVFTNPAPQQLAGTEDRQSVTLDLTCWGDGRLNFRRASDQAITQICKPVVGPGVADELVNLRKTTPDIRLSQAINQLSNLSNRQKQRLAELLTDASACHGLWVIVANPHRQWYYLCVSESSRGTSGATAIYFTW